MKHQWKTGLVKSKPEWVCCEKCGVIKNPKNTDAETCKGYVRVTCRESS